MKNHGTAEGGAAFAASASRSVGSWRAGKYREHVQESLNCRNLLFRSAADKADFTRWNSGTKGDFREKSGVQFFLYGFPYDAGDAKSDLCKFDEHVHGTDFQEGVQFDPAVFQSGVDMLAGYVGIVREHKGGVCFQGFGQVFAAFADLEVFKIGMGADEGVLDTLQRLVVAGEFSGGTPDQPQIDLAVFQKFYGLIGGLAVDGDLYVRVLLDKSLEIGKQNVPAQGCADTDAKLRDSQGMAVAQCLFGEIDGTESFLNLFIEKFSVLGQRDAAGTAGEQWNLQGFLQFSYGFADRRLADKKFFCRMGNISVAGGDVENLIKRKILIHKMLLLQEIIILKRV